MWNDAVWQIVVRVGLLTRSDCLKLCLCTRSTFQNLENFDTKVLKILEVQ